MPGKNVFGNRKAWLEVREALRRRQITAFLQGLEKSVAEQIKLSMKQQLASKSDGTDVEDRL